MNEKMEFVPIQQVTAEFIAWSVAIAVIIVIAFAIISYIFICNQAFIIRFLRLDKAMIKHYEKRIKYCEIFIEGYKNKINQLRTNN